MPCVQVNGIEMAYEFHGPEDGPTAMLLMGLAAQLVMWPPALIDRLTDAGFRVLLVDNRDVGLSTMCDGARASYDLHDMARDCAALIDRLGTGPCHVVGVSMGGMIGQLLAADHPQAIRSLAVISSSSGRFTMTEGHRRIEQQGENAAPVDPQQALGQALDMLALMGTPGEDLIANGVRDRLVRAYQRSQRIDGRARQLAAIVATGDFADRLDRVVVPTIVIHGSQDPVIAADRGRDVARAIPHAGYLELAGMGHDLPTRFLPDIAEAIIANMRSV